MQRDDRELIEGALAGLLQQRGAFALVHLDHRRLDHRIELRVGPAAVIAGPEPRFHLGRKQPGAEELERLVAARRPTAERHREAAFAALAEIDRGGHELDLGLHADALPLLGDGLDDLRVVDVAIVRAVDGQREALREAGFGEQRLGARRVIGRRLEAGNGAEHAVRQELGGGQGDAVHDPLLHRGAVQGERERLPHADVAQGVGAGHFRRGIARGVELQEHEPGGR